MLGGEVPELETTPCGKCGEIVSGDVIWDAWQGDMQFAAMPYHPSCAQELLPPRELSAEQRSCGLCAQPIEDAVLSNAFEALRRRFQSPRGSAATPEIVWRLKSRKPRVYSPEHFACVLAKAIPTKGSPE